MSQGEIDSPNTLSYEAWADSMEKEYDAKAGQQPSRTEPCTIHRVPDSIRIVDEGAYEPKMLSIGPYHRSNPKLKAMEDRKWHSLLGVLRRDRERRLSDYLKEMEGLEAQVRGFYSENEEMKRMGSKEFVEMMLLDGCYILELLLNADGQVNYPGWILPIISLDMLLLENQLPFLVLRHLFQFLNGSNNSSLVRLAVEFFKDVMPIEREIAHMDSFHHLLDLFHCYLTPGTSPEQRRVKSGRPLFIPSATEMQYPGVILSPKMGASRDVEFSDGVLKIPHLCINHSTNSIFRNLIAWEQCYPAHGNYFTSYAIFMDCLIDTPKDVFLLRQRGIIEHWLGNDEQVALLFNKMCMGVIINVEDTFLYPLSCEVNRFRRVLWNRWRDQLAGAYDRETMNFHFTVMTIFFTILQTAFAVLSYRRSS